MDLPPPLVPPLSSQVTPVDRPKRPAASHAHLVVALLSFLGMLANLEVSANATGMERWLELLLALACGLIALWAMHRLLHLLMWPQRQGDSMGDEDDGSDDGDIAPPAAR